MSGLCNGSFQALVRSAMTAFKLNKKVMNKNKDDAGTYIIRVRVWNRFENSYLLTSVRGVCVRLWLLQISTEDKLKGMMLYIWRHIQETMAEQLNGRDLIEKSLFGSTKGGLLRGSKVSGETCVCDRGREYIFLLWIWIGIMIIAEIVSHIVKRIILLIECRFWMTSL